MIKNIISFLVIILVLNSCIDVIDYNLGEEKERVVISGIFSDSLQYQEIKVSRSVLVNKDANTVGEPVKNAVVSITENDNKSIRLENVGNGTYRVLYKGVVGNKYKLSVKIDDNIYESTMSTMPVKSSFRPDFSTSLEDVEILTSNNTIVKDRQVVLRMNGQINDNDRLFYTMNGEFEFREYDPMSTTNKSCYLPLNIDIDRLNIITKDFLNGNSANKVPLLKLKFANEFRVMFCYHIKQYSINEADKSYFNKAKLLLNLGENLFDAPAGLIKGNIKNINNPKEEVLGNFTVASLNYYRHFTNGDKLNGLLNDICLVRFNTPRPAECLNCLTLRNASAIKPIYWPL